MFQAFFRVNSGEGVRVKKRKNHMMQFLLGTAVLISPWFSAVMAAASKSMSVEYKKYRMRCFPAYSALLISAVAYCTYNPAFGDFGILTRFLGYIADRPLSAYWSPEIVSAIGPFNWLFYIIAKFRDYALMCMLPGMVIYYIYGKITAQVCVEKNCHYRGFFGYYMTGLLFLQFFTILEHGRFIMAGCICLYAVYRELYLGKKDWLSAALYMLPLCFHLGILPLYAFRVFARWFSKSRIWWFFSIAFAYVMIMYSGSLFSFLPFSIMNYIEKARLFFAGGSAWGQYVFESRFYILLRIMFDAAFVVISMILMLLMKSRRFRSDVKKTKGSLFFFSFLMQLAFFSLITNLIVSEAFWRFGTLLFFFVPFLLAYAREYLSCSVYRIFQYSMMGLGFIITAMHMAMVVKNSILPYGGFIQSAKSFHFIAVLIHGLRTAAG